MLKTMMKTTMKKHGIKIIAVALALLVALPLLALAGCKSSSQGAASSDQSGPVAPPPILNPLTGKAVASADLIRRRPLAVKVENDPAARPQSGLLGADVVYEELVEGGVTRFCALFLSQDVSVIGPCRSARPSDIDIAFFHLPLFACSGGAPGMMTQIKQAGMLGIEEDGAHFWRDKSRRAPHNLYTSTALLREALASWQDDYNQLPATSFAFMSAGDAAEAVAAFSEATSGGGDTDGNAEGNAENSAGQTATSIDIAYGNACDVHYDYAVNGDGYLRTVNGHPNTDLTTGAQLQPTNVIVQYVQVQPSGLKDVMGADSPDSIVIGTGKAVIFSGGKVIDATWSKSSRNVPTVYKDLSGDVVQLHPGQTWVNFIPDRIALTYQ